MTELARVQNLVPDSRVSYVNKSNLRTFGWDKSCGTNLGLDPTSAQQAKMPTTHAPMSAIATRQYRSAQESTARRELKPINPTVNWGKNPAYPQSLVKNKLYLHDRRGLVTLLDNQHKNTQLLVSISSGQRMWVNMYKLRKYDTLQEIEVERAMNQISGDDVLALLQEDAPVGSFARRVEIPSPSGSPPPTEKILKRTRSESLAATVRQLPKRQCRENGASLGQAPCTLESGVAVEPTAVQADELAANPAASPGEQPDEPTAAPAALPIGAVAGNQEAAAELAAKRAHLPAERGSPPPAAVDDLAADDPAAAAAATAAAATATATATNDTAAAADDPAADDPAADDPAADDPAAATDAAADDTESLHDEDGSEDGTGHEENCSENGTGHEDNRSENGMGGFSDFEGNEDDAPPPAPPPAPPWAIAFFQTFKQVAPPRAHTTRSQQPSTACPHGSILLPLILHAFVSSCLCIWQEMRGNFSALQTRMIAHIDDQLKKGPSADEELEVRNSRPKSQVPLPTSPSARSALAHPASTLLCSA